MNYNLLGKSTLRISEIAFGCMSLSDEYNENAMLVNKAVDLGVNFFDTADMYQKGQNEETLGRIFKGNRQNIIIATKVGNQWRSDGSGWDWNPRKEYILAAVDDSLRRLQTDYIDLYQLHGGTLEDPVHETIEAFELLRQQGKIRYYGISSIRPNVISEYVQRSGIVSVMMQYSLLDRRPEESCLALLHEHKIGVLARGSLAKGLLSGKPSSLYLNHSEATVSAAADAVQSVSGKDRTPSQTSIRYILNHPAITSVVVGIRTIQQLEDAVKTSDSPGLTKSELLRLSDSIPVNRYDQHR